MTIRDKVRLWLGFIELEAYIAGVEKANRERHTDLEGNLTSFRETRNVQHDEVMGELQAIRDVKEQLLLIANILDRTHDMLQDKHVNRRPPVAYQQDWEQVQLDELATMLANPPKEEN